MYLCAYCKSLSEPREPLHKVVVETRRREYRNNEGAVVGRGHETVKELVLCKNCAKQAEVKVTLRYCLKCKREMWPHLRCVC